MTQPASHTFGDVQIAAVVEQALASPAGTIYPELHPDQVASLLANQREWLLGAHLDEAGNRLSTIRTWLVRDGDRVIVVDTCVGNHKHRAGTGFDRWHLLELPFLDRLAEAGVTPEQVDVVVCTHLHIDHVGWNTRWDGTRWVPTFPNARYLWVDEEWAYWSAQAADSRDRVVLEDSLQPVFDAGLVDLVTVDHAISANISLQDTRGHTPAHVALRVADSSGHGPGAVLSGDLMHSALQLVLPDLEVVYDVDPGHAVRARRRFLDEYADSGVTVFAAHFGGSGAGLIHRDGPAFRLELVDPAS